MGNRGFTLRARGSWRHGASQVGFVKAKGLTPGE
jgi:hypothetical protein